MSNTLNDQGQLVIDEPIREALGLRPGFIAVQKVVGNHVEIHFFPPEHDRSLSGTLANYVEDPLPIESWDEIRGKAWRDGYLNSDGEIED